MPDFNKLPYSLCLQGDKCFDAPPSLAPSSHIFSRSRQDTFELGQCDKKKSQGRGRDWLFVEAILEMETENAGSAASKWKIAQLTSTIYLFWRILFLNLNLNGHKKPDLFVAYFCYIARKINLKTQEYYPHKRKFVWYPKVIFWTSILQLVDIAKMTRKLRLPIDCQ